VTQRLAGNHAGTIDGWMIVRDVLNTRTSLDSKKLSAEHPDLPAEYQRVIRFSGLRVML
jgi:hypothetical protein